MKDRVKKQKKNRGYRKKEDEGFPNKDSVYSA
jgi:hypothetical protein